MRTKILYIEGCNYIDFPVGGQLTFAKQMIHAFGDQLALVGITTEEFPIGSWQRKVIHGREFRFFALFKTAQISRKPLVPRRFRVLFALIRYKKQIKEMQAEIVMTRAPEVIFPASNWGYSKLCYYFAGTGNPLELSQRWYGRLFAKFFDRVFLPRLRKVTILLAAADLESINEITHRSRGKLDAGQIKSFPTRINTEIFQPSDKRKSRKILSISDKKTVITTTGRLHWAKGWKLLLDSFQLFLKDNPVSIFYFLGDGHERKQIESYIEKFNLNDKVIIVGFQSHEIIARYINASDLFVMGSVMEGWATSLLEARACAIPICTTVFSSAKEIVTNGHNGIVVRERDPSLFAEGMIHAIGLNIYNEEVEQEMKRFSLDTLAENFLTACQYAKEDL